MLKFSGKIMKNNVFKNDKYFKYKKAAVSFDLQRLSVFFKLLL